MDASRLRQIADEQRRFFHAGPLNDISFRIDQLRLLKRVIESSEDSLLDALRLDLGKPRAEAYLSEIAIVLREIDSAVRHTRSWARPRRVGTPLFLWPGSSAIHPQPYGSVLIVAPWNYPFQLLVTPLVGALAAGNCAVLKASEVSPHTAAVIGDVINRHFDPAYVCVVNGGVEVAQALLMQRFDYIFFTGSPQVGRVVHQAAAAHLTPVTLELGGKNPCIVDAGVDVYKTARRIAVGKYINAGQTCIAPDFLVAHRRIKASLLQALVAVLHATYGSDPQRSPDYARIVSDRHFARLQALLTSGEIVVGGGADRAARYIAPTVIDRVAWTDPIMQEEIFGPLLPVLEYDDLSEVITRLRARPKPLACYCFSNDRRTLGRVVQEVAAGGVSINDTLGHFENDQLPFGGIGESGMGAYHGRATFEVFSHKKSVFTGSWLTDLRLLHPPYRRSLKTLKRLIRFVS